MMNYINKKKIMIGILSLILLFIITNCFGLYIITTDAFIKSTENEFRVKVKDYKKIEYGNKWVFIGVTNSDEYLTLCLVERSLIFFWASTFKIARRIKETPLTYNYFDSISENIKKTVFFGYCNINDAYAAKVTLLDKNIIETKIDDTKLFVVKFEGSAGQIESIELTNIQGEIIWREIIHQY